MHGLSASLAVHIYKMFDHSLSIAIYAMPHIEICNTDAALQLKTLKKNLTKCNGDCQRKESA